MWVLRMAKYSIKALIEKPHVSSKIRHLYIHVSCTGVLEEASLYGAGLCSCVEAAECRNPILKHIYIIKLCLFLILIKLRKPFFWKCRDSFPLQRKSLCFFDAHILWSVFLHGLAVWLIINFVIIKTFVTPDVIVTQVALGGTLTVLELVAALVSHRQGRVRSLSVHVCVHQSLELLGVQSVYLYSWISHDNCGQNIISVRGMCSKRRLLLF